MCDLCEKENVTKKFFLKDELPLFLCEKCYQIALHNPFVNCDNLVIARALLREYVILGREVQHSEPDKVLVKRHVV